MEGLVVPDVPRVSLQSEAVCVRDPSPFCRMLCHIPREPMGTETLRVAPDTCKRHNARCGGSHSSAASSQPVVPC